MSEGPKMEQGSHAEHLHAVEIFPVDLEKPSTSAYVADSGSSHHKTKAERALVFKIDCLIVPLLAFVYLMAYLVRNAWYRMTKSSSPNHARQDRNVIGNANVLGLSKDLGLTTTQFANCLSMFFVGYIVFMLPGNLLTRPFTPQRTIGGSVIVFGAVVIGLSAAKNYATVLSLRVLIGLAQAVIQGQSVYTSTWYKRDELASRSATISGAFGGLIAYGCGKTLTQETTGMASWRWVLVIEGSISVAVGIAVWLLLPPFPDKIGNTKKHWLFSAEEAELARSRSATYNTPEFKLQTKQLLATFKDPKTLGYATIMAAVAQGVNSIGQFLPTFIKVLGFSPVRAQLFTVIPYAFASLSVVIAIASDRYNKRGVFLLGTIGMACVGYIVLLCDVSAAVILLQTWVLTNVGGFTKRATTWAIAEVFGACFGIVGSHVYDKPPRFVKGHSVVLGMLAMAFVVVSIMIWSMRRANRKRDMELQDYAARHEVHPHSMKTLEDVQDFHVSFRYIL
ncbi:hypothetical protein LTR17_024998 [Elasticomyces elasticus]|nr:hypothetical protein LTR17_024998 [Elasticomyces elasticus]